MNNIVCTLFEGHYHYGIAALANSLYRNGFRGDFYVGYRGDLPKWVISSSINQNIQWNNARSTSIDVGMELHFLPIYTSYHLTNYKAEFLLQLLGEVAPLAKGIIYFDPDIVIKCRWSFFEQWCEKGVALVHELISNDMPLTHPIRMEWQQAIHSLNKQVIHNITSYINGGFCGISRKNIDFLITWKDVINLAIDKYKCDPTKFSSYDRTYPFWSIDQDSISVAAMSCNCPISEIGPEGMDFVGGGWAMSHATGNPKPWKKNYLLEALYAKPPMLADKFYWSYVNMPIKCFTPFTIAIKKVSIKITSFIGRFYRRY